MAKAKRKAERKPAAWSFEAAAACVQGQDWAGAREAYGHLARAHPTHLGVLCNLGLIDQLFEDWPQARLHFDQAVRAHPEQSQPYLLRADLHKRCGRLHDALDDYDRALALAPSDVHAHANRGNTLHALRRFDEALRSLDSALALDDRQGGLHYNRGNTLRELGRHGDAVLAYDQALRCDAGDHEAVFNRSLCLGSLGRWSAALQAIDHLLEHQPDHARAHSARGDWLKNLQQPQAALAAYAQALRLDPALAAAHLNQGNTLRELGLPEQALASYAAAVALTPLDWEAHYNRGIACHDLSRLDEALDHYGQALRLKPEEAQIRWNQALALLKAEQWHEGWRAYESRWALDPLDAHVLRQAGPRWTGGEPLSGRHILLVAEQGLGDTLQFSRYVHDVLALGARVTLLAPASLCGLLRSLGSSVEVVEGLEPGMAFDLHCPLMSLPLALGLTEPGGAHRAPYLRAEAGLAQAYALAHGQVHARFRGGPPGPPGAPGAPGVRNPRLRVGIAWSGNPRNRADRGRSLPLSQFRRALPPGIDTVVLQGTVRPEDLGDLQALRALPGDAHEALDTREALEAGQASPWLRDFMHTAAVCAHMDVVLTVDTSIAHLAAALGRPTWVLLHGGSDWRWLRGREDTDWYPSVRLFRQTVDGEWADVLDRVRHELAALIA